MRVLWITNILFPDICREIGLSSPVMGGWMYASAQNLLKVDASIKLAVATVYSGNVVKNSIINGITYYLLPLKGDYTKYNSSLENYWTKIEAEYAPDIVHIHGTELAHGLAYIRVCGSEKVVVSIQGLISVCARYYNAGISIIDILRNITFRDLIRCDTLFQQQNKFAKRGLIEYEYLKSVKFVIVRTSWDRIHSLTINPLLNYYVCNESLREEFYKYRWNYEKCEKYTIFLSQAGYPLKGLHQLLKALPIVLRRFPKTKVYVGGQNILNTGTLSLKIRQNGYSKYLINMIKKQGLSNVVCFLGNLSEKEICKRYLLSNLFICPSSIENSSNSLAEAQLLGVPFLTSYVGGMPDIVCDRTCLYRFEEYEILAEKICEKFQLFENATSIMDYNQAIIRHNRSLNSNQLRFIYNEIAKTIY